MCSLASTTTALAGSMSFSRGTGGLLIAQASPPDRAAPSVVFTISRVGKMRGKNEAGRHAHRDEPETGEVDPEKWKAFALGGFAQPGQNRAEGEAEGDR